LPADQKSFSEANNLWAKKGLTFQSCLALRFPPLRKRGAEPSLAIWDGQESLL